MKTEWEINTNMAHSKQIIPRLDKKNRLDLNRAEAGKPLNLNNKTNCLIRPTCFVIRHVAFDKYLYSL